MAKINVKDIEIRVSSFNDEDYLSLTDMLKAKDGEFFFSNWLRNRNTVEFLGIWEKVHNPSFNCAEFDIIKSQAGLNSYRLSAKEWMEKTNAIEEGARLLKLNAMAIHQMQILDGDASERKLLK